MRWTSTSSVAGARRKSGFSAVELLVGISLTVCLALAISPLWVKLQAGAVGKADESVAFVQSRVAVARLERDLRLAGAAACPFAVTGPVLQATPLQVVFLQTGDNGAAAILVEWELANGCLMRRWGACPTFRPSVFSHSLYVDHKTMLESVRSDSVFRYVVAGALEDGPVDAPALSSVEAVVLSARVGAGGHDTADVFTIGSVGR